MRTRTWLTVLRAHEREGATVHEPDGADSNGSISVLNHGVRPTVD